VARIRTSGIGAACKSKQFLVEILPHMQKSRFFANGQISSEFVKFVLEIDDLRQAGLARKVIFDELMRFESSNYSGQTTNNSTIDVLDGPKLLVELVLLRRHQEISSHAVQTVARETCIMPVSSGFDLVEYTLSDDSMTVERSSTRSFYEDSICLLGKTSETGKLYRLLPKSNDCCILVAMWKANADSYCVSYNHTTLERIEAVSTNIRESRLQFWLTFYEDLRRSVSPDLLESLSTQAETEKFRRYLARVGNTE